MGGLSVILYKPWRRRVDKKRVRNARFEPLSQDAATARAEDEEEQQSAPRAQKSGTKDVDVYVEPIEATDAAGPVHR
jgi:high-affinity nickel-transport protein